MSIRQAKNQLRKLIKAQLRQLNETNISLQSKFVLSQVIEDEKFQAAKKVALYMNMPNLEIRTMDIISHCFGANKEVYLPKCCPIAVEGRKIDHLKMIFMPNLESVKTLQPQGKYKLKEPLDGEDVMDSGDLDVIIVPGVAFTKSGKRLGHGAGYYDEFLNTYYARYGKVPYLIGVGLSEQLVEDIPTEDHDWIINEVFIGSRPK